MLRLLFAAQQTLAVTFALDDRGDDVLGLEVKLLVGSVVLLHGLVVQVLLIVADQLETLVQHGLARLVLGTEGRHGVRSESRGHHLSKVVSKVVDAIVLIALDACDEHGQSNGPLLVAGQVVRGEGLAVRARVVLFSELTEAVQSGTCALVAWSWAINRLTSRAAMSFWRALCADLNV